MTKRVMQLGWFAVVGLAVLGVAGCDEGKKASTVPIGTKGPKVTVTVTPTEVDDDGTTVTVLIDAENENGSPGSGAVVVTAGAGVLGGGSDTETLTLANGSAQTTFACDYATDGGCEGTVQITAVWGDVTGKTTVTVAGGGGGNEGGPQDTISVAVTASKTSLFVGTNDEVEITAKLSSTGELPANKNIRFTTTLGSLTGSADTGTPIMETADENGEATVTFAMADTNGEATIEATHLATGKKDNVTVTVRQVSTITYQHTKCSGVNCVMLGVDGSGFNEVAQVTFKVTDSGNKAAAGVPVTFAFADTAPAGTTVSTSATTDANGLASATITSGRSIGTFAVIATVIEDTVVATSPTLGVRGAKPTNNGLTLTCRTDNVGAYISNTPPAEYEVTCDFRVIDISGNFVGTGTAVNLKSEAGSLPSSANSKAFTPTGSNTDEGSGSFVFNTTGVWPPANTAPFGADAGQYPSARAAEPSVMDGLVQRNPRDGLITIMAYLEGEEDYDDTNQNGAWDAGERFYDAPEPFVDANDNNTWDVGEFYVDANQNSSWDAVNGVWDADTTVWVDTRILATGRATVGYAEPASYSGDCGSGVPRSATVDVDLWFPDLNLNRPPTAGTTQTAVLQVARGSATWYSKELALDGFGFGMDWAWVDGTTYGECAPASARCVRHIWFGGFGEGYAGVGRVTGAAPAVMTPCASNNIEWRVITSGITTSVVTPGAIE